MIFGTKVKNPTHHGRPYAACSGCGRIYTHLGIARHWAHCDAMQAKRKQREFDLGRKGVQLDLPLRSAK